jgi:acyl-coenzyme A thioesterase PaaI-like protein
MPDALFDAIATDTFQPTDAARGPWSPEALHGGPVAALLAGGVDELLEDLHPARLTVELLRPVPMAPVQRTARTIRPGRKVRLVGVDLTTEDGTTVATATALGIRRAEVAVPDQTPPPAPPGPDGVEEALRGDVATAIDYDAFHNIGVEHRFVAGAFAEPGPVVDWIRLRVPVVARQAPTPLQRVAAAADFGNGVSSIADWATTSFINPDLTIHLHRVPAGEWVCLDAVSVLGSDGVGLAESALWDERGPIGRSLQSLLVDAR